MICTRRNGKPSHSEFLIQDSDLFLKICFFRCFSHIFAIANQLPGFDISRLANTGDFFNINIFFEGKCKCEYKQFFSKIFLCSMLLKIFFLLPHLLSHRFQRFKFLKYKCCLCFKIKRISNLLGSN